jgi:Tfp pilus assembly protein PilO|tara:strand:+ start:370 stop:657 length:288 start_codon:yes stop_codon:yes gene_type:complete
MNTFNKFFADHGIKIIIAIMLLTYFKSCSIDSEVERIKKEQRILTSEIDTLALQLVNEAEMIKLIKEVPAWKTLRIEEISDKERISINALEEKDN